MKLETGGKCFDLKEGKGRKVVFWLFSEGIDRFFYRPSFKINSICCASNFSKSLKEPL